ncbi:MAG: gamma-glutamylcyclotransferase [Thermoleophilaceae bacterium]|nr:gamma-glutamylcyclotransferase [Thermoleophilaceae bacterium]
MTLLFSYGSNLAASEMQAWCPEARFAGVARLLDHRLEMRRRSIRWGGGAADLVAAAGEEVWGALYEVPIGTLERLDAKEGQGWAYRRVGVEVEHAGRRVAAEAYEVVEPEPVEVPPNPDYAALLVRGARERGLPEDYVERLLRWLAP